MTFDSLDWDAEAERVQLAFDVDVKGGGDCRFVRSSEEGTLYYYLSDLNAKDDFVIATVWPMSFVYYPYACYFYIGLERQRSKCNYLGVHRDGTITERSLSDLDRGIMTEHFWSVIAEGLFNLGWLTPEIEAALKTTYSVEKRQKWESKHRARLMGEGKNPAYDSMDWPLEARRIAAAFEVSEPIYFDYQGKGAVCMPTLRVPTHRRRRLFLKENFYADVSYQRDYRSFEINEVEGEYSIPHSCHINIGWDGREIYGRPARVRRHRTHYLDKALAKALFCLDLLTPEIEAALDADITAHEKLEWALEYEARMAKI